MASTRWSTSFSDLAAAELERDRSSSARIGLRTSASQPMLEGTGESPTAREWLLDPPRDLLGLALSGGGIRSATFNLGLLQGLHSLGLLSSFDYLSTVSGGGYIGAFWSAWRSRPTRQGHSARDAEFPAITGYSQFAEPTEVRHLREFSNFLIPRLGVLSYDTGRAVVAVASAIVPSFLAALSVIALALLVGLAMCRLIFLPYLFDGTARIIAKEVSLALVVIVTAALLVISERRWCAHEREANRQSYPLATAMGTLVVGAIWMISLASNVGVADPYGGSADFLPIIEEGRRWVEWLALLTPSAVWYLSALVLLLGRGLTSRLARDREWRSQRAAFDRVTSRLVFAGTAWLVVTILWCTGALVWYMLVQTRRTTSAQALTGLAGTAAAVATLFANVHRVFSQQPNKPFGGRLVAIVKLRLPQLLAYATVVVMVLGVVDLVLSLGDRHWIVWTGASVIVLLVLAFFDPNEVGLHSFYRGRIARAYLGASNPIGSRRAEEQASDDLSLGELAPTAPLHLICLTANDIDSRDQLANLSRGAESAVLSRVGFSVGDACARWGAAPAPTLAGAVTASGAAFNSQMGGKSMELGPAVTFVMAALNLRLGLWWRHPSFLAGSQPAMSGLRFFEEMFGLTRATGPNVHLSDGGHFENMAIYELVRRHCRYIVASDCGADPDVAFDDFGNLVRRVREDFGVEIVIDLTPLKPNDKGLARQPMVAGDIHYPGGDVGVLLLFKPTLVGNEPADISQYKIRNAAFPHESTGDQFYDEAQWESYRRLGEFASRSAFRSVAEARARRVEDGDDETAARRWATRVFARARRQWLPTPEGYVERLTDLVSQASTLDALLHEQDEQVVLRQVYKEVTELGAPVSGEVTRETGTPRNGASVLPDEATLAQSLHVIRRALLFMEEVFVSEDLGKRYNHPLYLGLVNYFARWAYAPLFRLWWPLLKPLYAQQFTSFIEGQFRLSAIDPDNARARVPGKPGEKIVIELKEDGGGFAKHCWQLQSGRAPRTTDAYSEKLVSYRLCTTYRAYGEDEHAYLVQAAQVIARMPNETSIAMWDARDFFVPPGLWGVGIGEDFLSRLSRGEGPLSAADHLLVRIPVDRNATVAARKEGADDTQLYRGVGFLELLPRAEGALWMHDRLLVRSSALQLDDDGFDSRFLVRCVAGRCPSHPLRDIGHAVVVPSGISLPGQGAPKERTSA
ncbi:MAG TPA: hypothetical protein VJO33_14165 [Gemmatimonadaceae bacterium]|nr:hypothetical protein [Gemmatimonadaceae bacterium]